MASDLVHDHFNVIVTNQNSQSYHQAFFSISNADQLLGEWNRNGSTADDGCRIVARLHTGDILYELVKRMEWLEDRVRELEYHG